MVGTTLERRYVVLEDLGADGKGQRFLAYDMHTLSRVHLRVEPESGGQPAGERVKVVDAAKPKLPQLSAKSKLATKPKQPRLATKLKQPKLAIKLKQSKLPQLSAKPKLATKLKQPKLATKLKQPKLATKLKQPKLATKPKQPKLAKQLQLPKPSKLLQLPKESTHPREIGVLPAFVRGIRPHPMELTQLPEIASSSAVDAGANCQQPSDLANANGIESCDAQVEASEAPGRQQPLSTRLLEAAWFAQGDDIHNTDDIEDEGKPLGPQGQALLEQHAANLTPEKYRKYALNLSPPAPPQDRGTSRQPALSRESPLNTVVARAPVPQAASIPPVIPPAIPALVPGLDLAVAQDRTAERDFIQQTFLSDSLQAMISWPSRKMAARIIPFVFGLVAGGLVMGVGFPGENSTGGEEKAVPREIPQAPVPPVPVEPGSEPVTSMAARTAFSANASSRPRRRRKAVSRAIKHRRRLAFYIRMASRFSKRDRWHRARYYASLALKVSPSHRTASRIKIRADRKLRR